jgi:hypothetical protein
MKEVLRHLPPPTLPAAPWKPLCSATSLPRSTRSGSHYSGGHWLASFAMLALED